MAHKKAAWSAKNLRDSRAKYRGVKLFGGQKTKAGNIIIRQKGAKFEAGPNTYMSKDFSIHASIDGVVKFFKKKKVKFNGRKYLKTYVMVVDETQAAAPVEKKTVAKKAAKKTTTKKVEKKSEEKTDKKPVKAKKPAAKKATTAKKAAPKKKAVTKKEEK